MQGAGAGFAGTTLGALGFGDIETAYASSIRAWKLLGTTETRNTCTYCAVGCGIIMYSKGNLAKGEKAEIIHIEGDPDHPTNRGRCARRARHCSNSCIRRPDALSANPQARSDKFERVSWDFALDRVARLMKDDRDKNFIAKNADGVTVNRWLSTGFSRPRRRAMKRRGRPTRWCAAPGCWHSIIKHAFDTARRWPVWPQHLAVVR